jgi:hypothetical protein
MVAMTTKTEYTARAQRSGKWWAISVAGVPAAHTQVRRLDQADAAVRDLLSLVLDRPADSFDIRLDADIEYPARAVLQELDEAKASYEHAQEAVFLQQMNAAAALTDAGFSQRDVGTLLGVSFQKASQLKTQQMWTSDVRARYLDPNTTEDERDECAAALAVRLTPRHAATVLGVDIEKVMGAVERHVGGGGTRATETGPGPEANDMPDLYEGAHGT